MNQSTHEFLLTFIGLVSAWAAWEGFCDVINMPWYGGLGGMVLIPMLLAKVIP